ncbi:hypothetical protein PI125_g3811 [Phytophthora idaei]|nr:hypothetical protein PI125_g3811 [Phytophthora idaei]
MYIDRAQGFYFHTADALTPEVVAGVSHLIGFMGKNSQGYWEAGHWVTIWTKDAESKRVYFVRKNRRSAFIKAFKNYRHFLERARGFVFTLWPEPVVHSCVSVHLDPRLDPDIRTQLQELDVAEPVRTQWASRTGDSAFLQHIPIHLKLRLLSAEQRRRNPLRLRWTLPCQERASTKSSLQYISLFA